MKIIKGSELSNTEYHSRDEFSSSQLKDAMSDVEYFYKVYIAKTLAKKAPYNTDALDVGSYYHAAILEPETLDAEFAVYAEPRRAGKVWTDFQAKHGAKTILNLKGLGEAETLIDATKASKVAMDLINPSERELSAFSKLEGVDVRVRADFINRKAGYIGDLKSLTGNARDESTVIKATRDRNYDMSAALYIDVFNSVLPAKEQIKNFYWVFASKDYANCRTYRMNSKMYELGKSKYMKALFNISEGIACDWKFKDDGIHEIDPAAFELFNYGIEKESDADLL